MQKIREMINANAIIGEPLTTADGITLIPVSKISFGLAGGGSDFVKKPDPQNAFGGGIGAGVNIVPIAFIIVKDGNARLMHISPPAVTTVDRIIETVPELFDKVTDFINKDKDKQQDSEEL